MRVLVVDDEVWVRELLLELLKNDYQTETASDGLEAWEKIQKNDYSIILLDLRMPRMSGIELLERLQQIASHALTIVITANNDLESAIQSMRLGAYDYLVKPFDNERLLLTVKNAVEKLQLETEVKQLRQEVEQVGIEGVIASSDAMKKIFNLVERVLDNDVTVLITGESGTGKEVVARAIHQKSDRRDKPFITLDCASIPESLIENEFFGHEKGSFTGAISAMPGKFELADGGTLFLDEIGNLKLDTQAKLLRVLQEREFTRIGGSKKIRVDVRFVCATNSDLEQAIREARFREDLYYRINVLPIKLPPLREREGDIPLLIKHFLKIYNQSSKKNLEFSSQAMEAFCQYHWPGNVRELKNIVQRLVVLKVASPIMAHDLPSEILSQTNQTDLVLPRSLKMKDVERLHILKVMELTNNNITQAANLLGLSRKTLHNKLKTY